MTYRIEYKGYSIHALSNLTYRIAHNDKFVCDCDSELRGRAYKSPLAAKMAITKHLKGE